MKSITDLLSHFSDGPGAMQMDCFITTMAGYGHPYAMYKQALRELRVRHENLFGLRERSERAKEALNDLQRRSWRCWRKRMRRRYRVCLEQWPRAIDALERTIEQTEFERDQFHVQADHLSKSLGNLKDVERRKAWEADMWFHRCLVLAASDILSARRVSAATFDMVLSMSTPMRETLTAAMLTSSGHRKLIVWHMARVSYLEEAADTLEPGKVWQLLASDLVEETTAVQNDLSNAPQRQLGDIRAMDDHSNRPTPLHHNGKDESVCVSQG